MWEIGEFITSYGYKRILINKTYRHEHIEIIEKHIGRKITKGEVVHHKDGNKLNNDLSNLQLMARGDHTRLHNLKRKGRK